MEKFFLTRDQVYLYLSINSNNLNDLVKREKITQFHTITHFFFKPDVDKYKKMLDLLDRMQKKFTKRALFNKTYVTLPFGYATVICVVS